ncbi:MAG: type II toxin-antitoxin system VapC family toxin [Symploca sp. SIO3E6]|nr:type II toxin-antitoxin system VapC family toxin [Caldora sp. SIO3E6]
MYLFDSNVCIRLLNENVSSNMARKLAELTPDNIRLCSVVKSELYYGAYRKYKARSQIWSNQWFEVRRLGIA